MKPNVDRHAASPAIGTLLAALSLAFAAFAVQAQTPATPAAPAAAASGAGAHRHGSGPGAGPGMGHGMGPMHGWRMNRENAPAWVLMTPAERDAHRDKIMGMKNREECLAYLGQHHAQMAERAKDKGHKMPAEPRHMMCERLPAAAK